VDKPNSSSVLSSHRSPLLKHSSSLDSTSVVSTSVLVKPNSPSVVKFNSHSVLNSHCSPSVKHDSSSVVSSHHSLPVKSNNHPVFLQSRKASQRQLIRLYAP
jgi:hypothetical protein